MTKNRPTAMLRFVTMLLSEGFQLRERQINELSNGAPFVRDILHEVELLIASLFILPLDESEVTILNWSCEEERKSGQSESKEKRTVTNLEVRIVKQRWMHWR